MNHGHIDHYGLAGRYLTGKLTPAESDEFEEHFVDCAECLSLLQTADEFRNGLRFGAAWAASHGSPVVLMKRAGKAQLGRWALVAAACLLLALAAGLIWTIRSTLKARAGEAE